jgi:aminopeptidase N
MLAWYATPGTPTLSISSSYSPTSQSLTLTVRQSNTKAARQLGKAGNKPLLIPLKVRGSSDLSGSLAASSPATPALCCATLQPDVSCRSAAPLRPCCRWQVGLVGPDGQDLPLRLKAASSSSKSKGGKGSSKASTSSTTAEGVTYSAGLAGSISTSVVLLVDSSSKGFTFTALPDKPCISLLRDFSAPVQLEVEGETDKQLGFLAQHDSNAFAR